MAREEDIEKAKKAKEEMVCPEGGIEWNRSCTDVLCCIMFLAFLVLMLGISGWALGEGDPHNIIMPFDSVGNKCGAKETPLEEYEYKAMTNLMTATSGSAASYYAVCVKECPTMGQDFNDNCYTNAHVEDCGIMQAQYNSEPQMGYCLPTKEDAAAAYAMITEEMEKQSGMG